MKDTQNSEKGTEQNSEQPNISEHRKNTFEALIFESLKTGGLNAVGYKGHGKTRFLFCIAENLMKTEAVRSIIFDSSDAWLYGFNRIEVFNICEHDITSNDRKSSEEIEKYQLNNWNLVKYALDTRKDLLFRLKTRSPSKRGFFIRSVVNYCDSVQRTEKEGNPNHENTTCIAYFLEEAQNAFNNRSTASTESEVFLSIFNEGRNFKECFFTACQRLNDFSKTIRTKQLQAIGKLNAEDLTPALRKIEKSLKIDFAKMKPKTWYYENSLFLSPEFKQSGKPYIINSAIKTEWLNTLPAPEEKKTLAQKIKEFLNPALKVSVPKEHKRVSNSFFESEEDYFDQQERESENSDLEEIEEEWIE